MTIYRIAKWEQVFERAESRKLKQLTWIAMPTGFGSNGYQSMLEEFGTDAAAMYGAWCVLVNYAASCHVRGLLATSRGIPLKLQVIARVTGFPVEFFERLVAWASRADIGWLECVSADECSRVLEKTLEKDSVCEVSGESPDEPLTSQGKPPYTRPNRTEPNKTLHNPTTPNRTEPDRTGHERARPVVDWSARWSAANVEVGFFERVAEVAKRLSQLKTRLDREFIWQVAWVGCEFDRDAVNDACDRCRIPGEVLKPKQYLGAVMVKLCERNGEHWDVLKKLVPPCPPPPRHASVSEALEALA